jgi:hypothetical protein
MEQKKIIIILILIAVLVAICSFITYALVLNQTEYTTMTIAESGTTIEVPDDMKLKSTNGDSGITVLENDNTIIVLFNSKDKGVGQIIGFSDIKNPIFGNEYQGDTTLKDPTVAGCHLDGECRAVYIGNNQTHDNILVISKNKDIVTHIINSIKWGLDAADNNTDNNNDDSGSNTVSVNKNTSNNKKYSQSDLDMARNDAYWQGYDDSYYDKQNDYYEDDDDYSSSDSSSSQSVVDEDGNLV